MLLLWRDRLMLLVVALLPWQARYLWKPASLFGVPWEQGTVSLFAVELLLILALACQVFSVIKNGRKQRSIPLWLTLAAFLPLAAFASTLWAADPSAALLASIRLCEGYALAYLVWISRAPLASVLSAFVMGTVLSSALGLWQFFTQTSFASTFLGIAMHDPSIRGVAVVETASGRFLRAYGTLPHPNVLGGYAAAGLVACLALAGRLSRFRPVLPLAALILGAGLLASFSRSAWLAVFGAVALILLFARAALTREMGLRLAPVLLAALGGAACVAVFALPMLTTRLSFQGRLEVRSVSERAVSASGGVELFRRFFVTGVGAGNYLPAAFSIFGVPANPYAVQPPHVVPLLVGAELGFFGLAVLLGFACLWCFAAVRLMRRSSSATVAAVAALPFIIIIVSCFDHYPFDIFSGTMLTGACFGFFLKAEEGNVG